MPFIPHTEAEIQAMLAACGAEQLDDLFTEIPADLDCSGLKNIPQGMNEQQLARHIKATLANDKIGQCFLGAGAYEHHIPAAVWDIASRGEFLTAYTPYQAEASQGTLQLIYEYQTQIASLMGLDVANASLYDGASALAEAVLMAVRCNKKSKSRTVLIPKTLHPAYRDTVQSIVSLQDINIIEIAYDLQTGRLDPQSLETYTNQDITAIVIPQPNFFGVLENTAAISTWAQANNTLVIASVNPIAMALLTEPGQWGSVGADIACGEGQSLGIPLSSGGPYFGFMCCKQQYVRQMPGRIIGRTADLDGNVGFSLTLQAREQHIRRSKATSNICTNQGLMVTAATIFMSLMGPEGLRRMAASSHANARELLTKLQARGVEVKFSSPYFHEFVIKVSEDPQQLLARLSACGIQAGYQLGLDYPELQDCLLVCVTETKNADDLDAYVAAFCDSAK